MAGSFRKLDMVVAAVLVLMLTVIVHAGARPVIQQDTTCNTTDVYVYPLGSACNQPVFYYVQQQLLARYYLERLSQGLAPEWDESNNTYYVRLSANLGAQYAVLAAATSAPLNLEGPGAVDQQLDPLQVNSSVYIFNVESQRFLKWRQEGSDEYFLIEEEASSASPAAAFRFVQATQPPLFCPISALPVVCHAYYLLSNPGSYTSDAGLLASVEDGITYVKAAPASSLGDLPLVLIPPLFSTATSTATT